MVYVINEFSASAWTVSHEMKGGLKMFYNMNAVDAGKIGHKIAAYQAPTRGILGSR